jgi:formate dehydrogenase subunit delta
MDAQRLVSMANDIGDFFAAVPDAAEARSGIATHIRKFWAPRMRRELYAHLDAHAGAGLKPLVLQALSEHRAALVPAVETGAAGSR